MRPQATGNWALLAALTLMWGTTYVFVKLAVATLAPLTIVTVRLWIAAALLGAWAAVQGRGPAKPHLRTPWHSCLALALVGNCIPFFLITWGQQTIDASLASVLISVMPLGVIVLAHFFVPGDRLTVRRLAGFAAGFAGIVLMIGPSTLAGLGGATHEITAQLAVVAAALCFSGNAVLARRAVTADDARRVSTVVMFTGGVLTLPLALALERPWTLEPSFASLSALAWLGVGPTAIATVLFFHLVARAGPAFMSLVNYVTPVIGLVVGVSALGERPGVTAYLGLALVLCGIAASRR